VDQQPAADVAAELGMTAAVYQAVYRFIRRVRRELGALDRWPLASARGMLR
jgi:hypothetical protein